MEDSLVMDMLRKIFPGCDPKAGDSEMVQEIRMNVAQPFFSEEMDRLMALGTLSGYSIHIQPSYGYIALSMYRIKEG